MLTRLMANMPEAASPKMTLPNILKSFFPAPLSRVTDLGEDIRNKAF